MLHRSLAAAALTAASLLAQTPSPASPAAPTPTPPAAPTLPEAGSPAATALLDKAIAKMQAYGRGAFATTLSRDEALLRGQNLPFGGEDVEVAGGWHRELVWGDCDGDRFVRANGRMLARIDDGWRLRATKLAGGRPAPFTVEPDLLFTALASLPAEARKVVHVEAGEVAGRQVAVLSLALVEDVGREFVESGAVPGGGGGPGSFLVFGPGIGMDLPQDQHAVYVALSVDPASGDVLRVASKAYQINEAMGNVHIQIGDGDDDDDEPEPAADEPAAGGALVWKKGLPTKKPAKGESVASWRVDFKDLGLAEPPALDDKAKGLLRLR
jgi:hypothetical protein